MRNGAILLAKNPPVNKQCRHCQQELDYAKIIYFKVKFSDIFMFLGAELLYESFCPQVIK